MMEWRHRFDYTSIVKRYKEGKISLKEMASSIIDYLKSRKFFYNEDYQSTAIVDNLEYDLENENFSVEDYDMWLDSLYDWADYNRVWVAPSF